MDQRPGQLDQNEEETVIRTDGAAEVSIRPATSSDVLDSERDIAGDLQKVEGDTDDTSVEPELIKEQIEQTRSQMSETIDAIQEKLSFANLSEQVSTISEQVKEQVSEHITNAVDSAKDAVYDATIGKAENIMQTVTKGLSNVSESMGDAGTYVVRSAKQNPLPLALIGLGIGMLLMQSRSGGVGVGRGKSRKGGNQGNSTFRQVSSTATGALSSAQKSVSNVAGSAYEGVGNVAGSAYEGVTSAASSAYGGVSGAANSAYQGVTSFAGTAGEQVQYVAKRAQTQYERTLEENPLAVGAVALALGAIVGLSIPSTQYENQWMGETRENLVNTVEDAAREALEKAQQVAGEVSKTVREQAQGQANG